MTLKPLFVYSAFAALTLSSLVAEDKPDKAAGVDSSTTAHQIIDRMVEAIGGEEAVKSIKTRVASGQLSMKAQGISVNMKVSQKAPDKVVVIQEIPGIMTASEGFDGEKGWAQDPLQGSRAIEGDELKRLKREANITREITLKEEYPTMTLLPEETEGDRTFQVIQATSADERTETWHFDKKTGLMAKMKQKMKLGPAGELDVTLILKDYREVDGIQIPYTTEMENPSFKAVLTMKEVKHNVELDDKIFAEPVEDEDE